MTPKSCAAPREHSFFTSAVLTPLSPAGQDMSCQAVMQAQLGHKQHTSWCKLLGKILQLWCHWKLNFSGVPFVCAVCLQAG